MENNQPNTDNLISDENIPYEHCLNCGAELNGNYCHQCGQQATNATPTVKGFILEYLGNEFIWDEKLLPTLWNLIRRPGHLTNEFLAGKFVSYEHPLKLNMFFLLLFVTLFLLFSDTKKMENSVYELTTNELVFPNVALTLLTENEEYAEKLKQSPCDTVTISAPLQLAQNFPQIVSPIEVLKDTEGTGLDVWKAVLPKVLLDEGVLRVDSVNNIYRFNTESEPLKKMEDLALLSNTWKEMLGLITQYFPLIVLLTIPFISLALKIVYRKERRPFFHHFIFALHYTALLELLLITVYLLSLLFSIPSECLQWFVIIGSCAYLAIAVKRVYQGNSWFASIAKSFVISLVYLMICFMAIMTIFIVAILILAAQMQ